MRTLILYFLLLSLSANSQILPDSIRIIKNDYTYNYTANDSLINSEKYAYKQIEGKYICDDKKISKSKILGLLKEISNSSNKVELLSRFDIDTLWIKNNPEELINRYSNKYYYLAWNKQQKEFIFRVLTDLNNYNKCLIGYLSNGGSYTMHNYYRQEYVIQFYNNGLITNLIKSRKYVWGYQMPWVNETNDTIYNLNIELLLKPYTDNRRISKPKKGEQLLKQLTNEIIDNNMQALYKLSAYTYLSEIEELKTDFTIVSHEEVYGKGRYIWNEPKTMKITLKNESMLPNVYFQFLASKYGETLYSRDSVKKDFKEIVNRVQSISFIIDYLKQNPNVQLDIYYFNNSGINQYNIDGVNKNPTEWKKQDDYIESLNWYEKNNIKPSFDIDEAIKIAERNNCGCNYRFDNDFIKKAVFFELTNKVTRENSVWFLLPDNRVLLYIMEGNKVLNYDYEVFGKYTGIQFPCVLFTSDGKMIERK